MTVCSFLLIFFFFSRIFLTHYHLMQQVISSLHITPPPSSTLSPLPSLFLFFFSLVFLTDIYIISCMPTHVVMTTTDIISLDISIGDVIVSETCASIGGLMHAVTIVSCFSFLFLFFFFFFCTTFLCPFYLLVVKAVKKGKEKNISFLPFSSSPPHAFFFLQKRLIEKDIVFCK
jgi:hypothetical protein